MVLPIRPAVAASFAAACRGAFSGVLVPTPRPPTSSWSRVATISSRNSATRTAAIMSMTSSSGSGSGSGVIDAPYGSWKSPITSKAITAGSVGISSLMIHSSSSSSGGNGNGNDLLWLEARPKEGGRVVLCRYDPTSPDRSERDAVDVTPDDGYVRTRVHEYGGGSVTLGGKNGEIYYSEFKTQRVMKLIRGSSDPPVPITPGGDRYRFADGAFDSRNDRLIMVREDHKDRAKPADVVNEIVSVAADGSGTMDVLATGNDFYSNPRLSPDGTRLAYVTWNHPNMPWDATELRVTSLTVDGGVAEGDGEKSAGHVLVDGADGDTSILQPLWHPQTGDLYYISDASGHYNIYRASLGEDDSAAAAAAASTPILPMEYDFGGSSPGWRLGQQGFHFLPDGRLLATFTRDGQTRLVVADVIGNEGGPATNVREYGTDDGLPMQFGGIVCNDGGDSGSIDLYFLGGSPSTPPSVYRWNLEERGQARQLACSSTLRFPDDVISVPRQVEFPTTLGRTAFGYYYPPKNGAYECTTDEAPPLLVKAHGGPTSCTGTSFNPGIQYWTSRGFAILDVDYGGSTGYGRDYRRRLRGSWGIVDVDDVCAGAKYLVDQGLAHPERLCIDGGSAGGYTTLSALAFRDVFTAGCSLYGIGDLTALAGDTHKFESRYLDGLVGEYPRDAEIYRERSPIESVDTLSCPILLLQGDEDRVVPPNQAERMHEALLGKGIPSCLKIYEGEQHGFRRAENIEDALDSELAFFGRCFGIEVPDALELEISNM